MHFKERRNAHEMERVQDQLINCVSMELNRDHSVTIDSLSVWSDAIRTQFDIDNIHCSSCARHDNTTTDMIATGIQHFSNKIDTFIKMPGVNSERLQKIEWSSVCAQLLQR